MKIDKNILAAIVLFAVGGVISFLANYNPARADNYPAPSEQKSGVICLNPAGTEIIYALGCENQLKAVSRFCNFPPQAKEKKIAGDFLHPDFEAIRAINPQMVIVMGKSEKLNSFCKEKGYEIFDLNLFNIDGVFTDIHNLAEKLNCPQKGEELIAQIKSELDYVKSKTVSLDKVKVFVSMSTATADSLGSLATVSGGTLVNDLVEIAGGENIFADIQGHFPSVSKESLLIRRPQVIIEPSYQNLSDNQKQAAFKAWRQLDKVPAVANGKIFFPDADLMLKPGPRTGKAAMELAKMIHPEAFANE